MNTNIIFRCLFQVGILSNFAFSSLIAAILQQILLFNTNTLLISNVECKLIITYHLYCARKLFSFYWNFQIHFCKWCKWLPWKFSAVDVIYIVRKAGIFGRLFAHTSVTKLLRKTRNRGIPEWEVSYSKINIGLCIGVKPNILERY